MSDLFFNALNDPEFRKARLDNMVELASQSPSLKDIPEEALRKVISNKINYSNLILSQKKKFLMEDLPRIGTVSWQGR